MGKIRERRRRERRKRLLKQYGIGIGGPVILLVVFVLVLMSVFPKGKDETVGTNKPIESQKEEHVEADKIKQPQLSQDKKDIMQIVMIGDMLMHEKTIQSGEQEDGTYNFDHIFANVKDMIQEADLAIANQETMMGGLSFGYTGYPSFNTPFELADAEVKVGFDVLLFATNHAFDKGVKGVENCMDYLDSTYPSLGYVGINRSEEDQESIYTYEANGITVAILNYTYGHNGLEVPNDKKYLINELDEEKIRSDIRKAEEISDFTIVCPHWGTEFKLEADDKQKEWTSLFLEEGVDLVLGTHPHVIEPIEWLTREDGHQMLVYYSIGNFVNGTNSTGHGVTHRMLGGIADITIQRNKKTNEVEIVKYGGVPIVCHIADGTEYTVYYLEDYTEELASKNEVIFQDSEFSKALCESIFHQVWGE